MIKRREFMTLLGGAAAAWPLAARAQQQKVYRIGVLSQTSPSPQPLVQALTEGLRSAGYVEGRNLRLEVRIAEAEPQAQAENAAELVALKVDAIVTFFTPPAVAAKQATSEIPVIMAGAGEPVATGLVASLAHPGGNVTGLSSGGAEVASKSVELIRELVPTARRIGLVLNELDPFAKAYAAQVVPAAARSGLDVETLMMHPGMSAEPGFAVLSSKGVDALIVQGSSAREVLELAIRHRIPALSSNRLGPLNGALMSYGSDYFELARQAAVYVDKILKGAKPGDLPVAFPTKFELIINLNTARAIGLEISPVLLARADEVIE